MATMLERSARDACDYISSNDPEFMAWENLSDENKREYEGLARAVLMAVREADDSVCAIGDYAQEGFVSGPGDARTAFTAMIDAILNEKDSDQ